MKQNLHKRQILKIFGIFLILCTVSTEVLFAQVQGKVWLDKNSNGQRDDTEEGLKDIHMELYFGQILVATDTSDVNGNYEFSNLTSGYYSVKVKTSSLEKQYAISPFSNYFSSAPSFDEAKDSDVEPIYGYSRTFKMNSNILESSKQIVDIGIAEKYFKFSGKVWNDTNKNGIFDETNTPEPNVKVYVKEVNSRKIIDSTLTDLQGSYTFDSITSGTQMLQFVRPFRKYFTKGSGVNTDGTTTTYFLDQNQVVNFITTKNVGLIPDSLGSLGGVVWEDINKNGVRDIGEKPLKNIEVRIFRTDGAFAASNTRSNNDGKFYFTNLRDGTYYCLITPPLGYLLSLQNSTIDSLDSDFDQRSLEALPITLINDDSGLNKNNHTLGAGLYKSNKVGSIGGQVWNDTNLDGWKNANETFVSNINMFVSNSRGIVIDTVTTDSNGQYLFNVLAGGSYQVNIDVPFEKRLTTTNNGTPSSDSEFKKNGVSWLYGTTVYSYMIDTTKLLGDPNRDFRSVDAGLITDPIVAKISGSIWEDSDKNGVFNTNEKVLAGQKVELWKVSGPILKTVFSNSEGKFDFGNIQAGSYHIMMPDLKQYVGPYHGIFDFGALLFPQPDNSLVDIVVNNGFIPKTGKISGNVWKDVSKNGRQSSFKIPNSKVILHNILLNTKDSTITSQGGNYTFENLASGKYLVQFIAPPGLKPTLPFISTYNGNSDVDSTGFSYELEIDVTKDWWNSPYKEVKYLDAGFIPAGQINGFAWDDENLNGVRDNNENPIRNTQVRLSKNDGTNVFANTDINGSFVFNNLELGRYIVKIPSLINYAPTIRDSGSDDSKDSDIDLISGESQIIAFDSSTSNSTNVILGLGYIKTNAKGSIGNKIWKDLNKNQVQELDEPGISGIIIELYRNNSLVAKDTTDSNGFYSFNNLDAGVYQIRIIEQSIPFDLEISGQSINGISGLTQNSLVLDNILLDYSTVSQKILRDIDINLVLRSIVGCYPGLCLPIKSVKIRN